MTVFWPSQGRKGRFRAERGSERSSASGPARDAVYRTGPVASEQLFDLIFDPYEAHNLADDPTMGEVLEEMRGRMERWMRDTDDPLLQGPVPAPLGARVNDPDGLSPREPTRVVGE